MKIPLANKIKKQAHKDIAAVQDVIIEELYTFFPQAVFHGGTAIWRCYQGNRFSEDIDVYLATKKHIPEFFTHLESKGFIILKKRLKENSLYSLLQWNRTQVRFEATFHTHAPPIVKDYELIDGTSMTVYTLSPDDLITEKIAACVNRKKVRDLYDIFFLLKYAAKKPKQLTALQSISLIDEKNLSTIIITGLIPSVQDMKRYIKEWAP